MSIITNEDSWGVSNALADEYMAMDGTKKAGDRFKKLVRDAAKVLETLPKRIREEVKVNLEMLKNDELHFYRKIRNTLSRLIRQMCLDKVWCISIEAWREYITQNGGIRNIFNRACREVLEEDNVIPRIYMNAFINAYRRKEQTEVFEILVALPEKMLKRVSKELDDFRYCTIYVCNGQLVVCDND